MGLAVVVVLAAAEVMVEQLAGDPGGDDLAGDLVLKTDQTAQPTAVAQALPLARGHLLQGLGFPKGLFRHQTRVLNPNTLRTNSSS